MQNMHKLAVALIAVVGIQNAALAYKFTFSNHTDQPVKLLFNLATDGTDYEHELQPNGEAGHEWELWFKWIHEGITDWENNRRAGFCWSSLKIKEQMRDRSGNVMLDRAGNPKWGSWRQVDVKFIESDSYQKLVAAAEDFTSGIATAATAAAAAAKGGDATNFSADKLGIAKGAGGLIANSKCKDRHFDILQFADQIEITTLAD